MKDPKPINLKTLAEVRAEGWAAEARDGDGHLISTYSRFDNDADIIGFVRSCMAHGETVTIWPGELPARIGDTD